MVRWLFGIVVLMALAGCAPRVYYDGNVLARDDGAFSIQLGPRDRVRWQLEIPDVAGAPRRYGFAYDALLYRIRIGKPGLPPELVLVAVAHEYPEGVTKALSITDRNQKLFEFAELLLAKQGLGELTGDIDRYFFDGRSLSVSNIDQEEPLVRPGLGAAFIFGAEFIFECLYEIYPIPDDALSSKELATIVTAMGELLAGVQVK